VAQVSLKVGYPFCHPTNDVKALTPSSGHILLCSSSGLTVRHLLPVCWLSRACTQCCLEGYSTTAAIAEGFLVTFGYSEVSMYAL